MGEHGLKFKNMASALQRTQHSQHFQGSVGEIIRRQWVAAYIIMFVSVASDSAFHKVGFKTGADAGFLLLQPDIVKITSKFGPLRNQANEQFCCSYFRSVSQETC